MGVDRALCHISLENCWKTNMHGDSSLSFNSCPVTQNETQMNMEVGMGLALALWNWLCLRNIETFGNVATHIFLTKKTLVMGLLPKCGFVYMLSKDTHICHDMNSKVNWILKYCEWGHFSRLACDAPTKCASCVHSDDIYVHSGSLAWS